MFTTEYGAKLSSHCWFLASVLEEFGEFFPLYHSNLLSPLLFYVSKRRASGAFENRMVKDSLVVGVRAAVFFISLCVPHGGILKHVLLF